MLGLAGCWTGRILVLSCDDGLVLCLTVISTSKSSPFIMTILHGNVLKDVSQHRSHLNWPTSATLPRIFAG